MATTTAWDVGRDFFPLLFWLLPSFVLIRENTRNLRFYRHSKEMCRQNRRIRRSKTLNITDNQKMGCIWEISFSINYFLSCKNNRSRSLRQSKAKQIELAPKSRKNHEFLMKKLNKCFAEIGVHRPNKINQIWFAKNNNIGSKCISHSHPNGVGIDKTTLNFVDT